MQTATVFAPATVANVAVGFDVLGFALDVVGDRVTVTRTDDQGIRIAEVSGVEVPRQPERNTAGAALLAMSEDLDLPFGFEVKLEKGIPISSGMGGSAASAVGAVVAAHQLVEESLYLPQLLDYALAGEAVASGAMHGDNVAPCLYGGLVAVLPGASMSILELPVPKGICCVVVCPNQELDTKSQRQALSDKVPMDKYVQQSALLAGFIAACYKNDHELLKQTMQDVVVGPQRVHNVPGAMEARAAALDEGALGCSLAGSGPSLFAWTESDSHAQCVQAAMVEALAKHDLETQSWIGPVGGKGAGVVDCE